MKPRFALDLTNDTISLLERSHGGWTKIGATGLDVPDLDGEMARLRCLMETRAPGGFCSKLILPNSQILYVEVPAPGPDRQSRRGQIAAALEGRTPYDVADLVFDWSQSGQTAKVAVVARETLDEAEAFAENYSLRPVAHVAVPETGRFGGEPFFGLTARHAEHLPEGERLDRDQDPVNLIATDLVPEAGEDPDTPTPVAIDPARTGDVAPAEPEPAGEGEPEPTPDLEAVAPAPAPEDMHDDADLDPVADEPALAAAPLAEDDPAPTAAPDDEALPEISAEPPAEPALEAAAVAPPSPEPAPPAAPTATPLAAEAALDEAPFIAIDDDLLEDDPARKPLTSSPDGAEGGHAAQTAAILRRIEQAVAHARMTEAQVGALTVEREPAPREGFQSRRPSGPGGAEGSRLASVAPRLGGLAANEPGMAPPVRTPPPVRPQAPRSSARFGTRRKDPAQASEGAGGRLSGRFGGSSRATLIVLVTAALGFLLLAVALWSLLVGGDTAPPTTPPAAASAPAEVGQTMEATPATPAAPAATADSGAAPAPAAPATPPPASAATGTETQTAAVPPAPDVAAAPPPAAEQIAPPVGVPAVAPGVTKTPEPDAAATATGDAAAPAAAGLPPAEPAAGPGLASGSGQADASLPAQPLPLPLGKMPALGPDGQLQPTAEGVMSPEGFMLFAGKPPVLPPARPTNLAESAARAAQAANPLFAVKPRPRPATLVVPAPAVAPDAAAAPSPAATPDTAATAEAPPPAADPRLANPKPRSRPAAVLKTAEAAHQKNELVADAAAAAARAEAEAAQAAQDGATAQAVGKSEVPTRRPKAVLAKAAKAVAAAAPAALPDINSADAVAAALNDAADTAPASEPAPAPADTASQPVEEPEPKAGVPTMPTTKTVAKKSTLANVLDLGDVNLIGVYGSPSHRRALVRMPNGRFIKVQIGDMLDGGQVAAIGDNELTYVKNGRTYVLKMVKGG